jgi:hypothetical protein
MEAVRHEEVHLRAEVVRLGPLAKQKAHVGVGDALRSGVDGDAATTDGDSQGAEDV